jgi:uncharacterized membrane protein
MRRSLEAIGLFALAGLLWVTGSALYGPEPLPARVPTHFDLAGHPNGWGSPAALFLLPAIALVLYGGMSLTARFPSVFNYPVRVTPENRLRLEGITISLLTWIKVEMVCLFAWIQIATIQLMRQGGGSLSPALFPLGVLAIFLTIAWHLAALFRAARTA